MSTLFILAIDSDDDYSATLHATRIEAEAALAVWVTNGNAGLEPTGKLYDTDELIGWLQDRDIEVNITEAELPDGHKIAPVHFAYIDHLPPATDPRTTEPADVTCGYCSSVIRIANTLDSKEN